MRDKRARQFDQLSLVDVEIRRHCSLIPFRRCRQLRFPVSSVCFRGSYGLVARGTTRLEHLRASQCVREAVKLRRAQEIWSSAPLTELHATRPAVPGNHRPPDAGGLCFPTLIADTRACGRSLRDRRAEDVTGSTMRTLCTAASIRDRILTVSGLSAVSDRTTGRSAGCG